MRHFTATHNLLSGISHWLKKKKKEEKREKFHYSLLWIKVVEVSDAASLFCCYFKTVLVISFKRLYA